MARYYSNTPSWGTNQFQFGPPPTPAFQPQPSWGGVDFYNAHAINPDPSLYNHAFSRAYSGIGVGLHEASHWHRNTYGGAADFYTVPPEELGHAAAYEAYRTWNDNSSLYEPLSGDIDRQREGLIGLAVGEATRLLQYSNYGNNSMASRTVCEAAAATAAKIFSHSQGRHRYRSRSRSRSRAGSVYGDEYGYDDDVYSRGRSRSRLGRSRSHSRIRSRSPFAGGSPYMGGSQYSGVTPYAGSVPIPGVSGSSYNGGIGSGGYSPYSGGVTPHSVYNHGSSAYGGNMYPTASSSYTSGGMPMPMPNQQQYAGSSAPMMMGGIPGGRMRSTSMSVPYGGAPTGPVSYVSTGNKLIAVPAGQMVVIPQKHKKHKKHRSRSRDGHHHHHHRARSVEPPMYVRY